GLGGREPAGGRRRGRRDGPCPLPAGPAPLSGPDRMPLCGRDPAVAPDPQLPRGPGRGRSLAVPQIAGAPRPGPGPAAGASGGDIWVRKEAGTAPFPGWNTLCASGGEAPPRRPRPNPLALPGRGG